jgi:IS30 family transposase
MPRAVKLEIRDRLLAGGTWVEVAAAVGVSKRTIARLLNEAGGMPPRWTDRPPSQLSLAQREEISLGLAAGDDFAVIGRGIGCHRSTVKREVDRNGGRQSYRAWRADRDAFERARRPKPSKLMSNPVLRGEVEAGMLKRWSPEQISSRLVVDHPDDEGMRVSHETIYQSLFVQAKGGFRKEIVQCLRSGRTRRRPQSRVAKSGRIKDMVMISERPAEIEDRAVPGHWEGDLIIGQLTKSAVVTLVERATRYLLMIALEGDHKAETVAAAMAAGIQLLPTQLCRSITWDQGKEMAGHVEFTIATDIAVYFCDPHSPWQRGTNENTNGLIRQYLPKGTDLSVHTQADLDKISDELNGRPRKTLQFMTPSEKFNELVATTP